MATLDPVTRQFLDMLASGPPGPQLHELPPARAREISSAARTAFADAFPAPPADVEDRVIEGAPNGDLAIHIVRPSGAAGPLPAVMFFHGGGWLLGNFATHRRLVHELAAGAQAAVVFVDYSLSPEAHFPVANEEAYFATKYVAANAKSLNIDPERIAVGGDSAGANMATVVCMMAKDRGGPTISGAVLLYPLTDARFDTPSYKEFGDGYFLSPDAMKWFWDNYLPDKQARRHPQAAVLHATDEQLRALPPTFVMTCECDVLRDEGEAFASRLIAAGVPTTSVRYLGTIHTCLTQGPLANTPAVRSAIAAINTHLRATLA